MLIEILCGIAALIVLSFILKNRKPEGYAKGALSFPILGHLPYFAAYTEIGFSHLFTKWSKIYGPIFRVDFASQPAVVLNDYKLIREAWNLPQFSGRFRLPINLVRMGNDGKQRGIIFNDGQNWADQRRFSLRHLKDFGLGKNTMESIILDEAIELINRFRDENGSPVSTQNRFNAAIINAFWTIVAGERFKQDDPKLAKLVDCVMQNLTDTGSAGVIIFMPTLSKTFPKLTGWQTYLDALSITNGFIRSYVQSRVESHRDECINDFTDAYIQQINNTTDPESSFYKEEGIKSLVTSLDDMFTAGGETTSTTLTWLLMCVAIHPDIQKKFHAEIDNVVGRSRLPSLSDRPSMVYTEALIHEVLRMSSVIPTGVFHYCLEDTVFHDILIPKGTSMVPNIYAAHHDKQYWGDPENFRPERFLSEDGKSLVRHEALIAFSSGKRVCLGENLARDELFLVSTSLFQAFNITPDPSEPPPTMKQNVNGLIAKTQPHKLVFQPR